MKRWSDDVDRYMAEVTGKGGKGSWCLFAEDRDGWREMSTGFAARK